MTWSSASKLQRLRPGLAFTAQTLWSHDPKYRVRLPSSGEDSTGAALNRHSFFPVAASQAITKPVAPGWFWGHGTGAIQAWYTTPFASAGDDAEQRRVFFFHLTWPFFVSRAKKRPFCCARYTRP